jgi:uracil-DNA glycosylase
MPKIEAYAAMVADRKKCRACAGLTNPADVDGGKHDSDHIGPWSRWQGNLDAKVMVVGQDWGDINCLRDNVGVEPSNNRTNVTLVALLDELGVKVDLPQASSGQNVVFFTNAILCLKEGGLQADVQAEWFRNCGSRYLRRQIEIINPMLVIGLGTNAFQAILAAFSMKCGPKFLDHVEDRDGTLLPNGSRAFAAYHCGARVLNTHRKLPIQQQDWRRMRPHV